jgi:hypothetical protein
MNKPKKRQRSKSRLPVPAWVQILMAAIAALGAYTTTIEIGVSPTEPFHLQFKVGAHHGGEQQ